MLCGSPPKRGQIFFVNLSPTEGREQAGRRPVLVVSDDVINRLPLVISVIAGTDAANTSRNYPTNVQVTATESGLPKDTVFLCFQVRALDPSRFPEHPAGTMPAARMTEVDAALHLMLSL
jgi:mRNA interferase MazF